MSTLSISACRVESLEALPILSHNPSRGADQEWETASAASSLASVAEYTGPKLFKEPSSKPNKPIIPFLFNSALLDTDQIVFFPLPECNDHYTNSQENPCGWPSDTT